jgi:hypothetical protein
MQDAASEGELRRRLPRAIRVNISIIIYKPDLDGSDRERRAARASGFGAGALMGATAWHFFVLTHSLNTRFEGRKPSVLLINNVLYLATYAVFAGVHAV